MVDEYKVEYFVGEESVTKGEEDEEDISTEH